MFIALVAALGLSLSAQASYLDTVCSNAQRSNPNNPSFTIANPPVFAGGFIARKSPLHDQFVIETMEGVEIFKHPFRITSMVLQGDTLWALAGFELLEVSSTTGELLGRHVFETQPNPAWRGKTMVLADDLLVIARGLAGMTAFNTVTHKIQWNTLMSEVDGGMPVSVEFDGAKIWAVMATTRQNGFTGFAAMDMTTGRVTKATPYDQRRAGVIETEPSARWFNDSIVLNNAGWIHVVTRQQLESGKAIRPRWVAQPMPQDGEVQPHYMMLVGEFFFEQNNLIGCGAFTAQDQGRFIRKSSTFSVKMP